jgi:hypothetical protein
VIEAGSDIPANLSFLKTKAPEAIIMDLAERIESIYLGAASARPAVIGPEQVLMWVKWAQMWQRKTLPRET